MRVSALAWNLSALCGSPEARYRFPNWRDAQIAWNSSPEDSKTTMASRTLAWAAPAVSGSSGSNRAFAIAMFRNASGVLPGRERLGREVLGVVELVQ